jgi:hypothetical protein
MGWLILFVFPAVAFLLLDLLLFGRPPRWVMSGLRRLRPPWHPPRPVPYDPFDTLTVQHRLAALAAEIQRLDADRKVFAKAHRIRVAQAAYDAVLVEACRLAGVEPVVVEIPGPYERAREELELAARGWFW